MLAPFTVISWNLQRLVPFDPTARWSWRRQRVAQFLQECGVDVLCAQESDVTMIADLAQRLGDYRWIGWGRDDGRDRGECTGIVYDPRRMEVRASSRFWLSPNPHRPSRGWDARHPRLVSAALLEGAHGRCWVVNCHLDHRGHRARLHAAALNASRCRRLATNAPVVVAGDFNCGPHAEAISLLTKDLHDSRHHCLTPPVGSEATWAGVGPCHWGGKRIDYVFVDPRLHVLAQAHMPSPPGRRRLSDHQAVWVRLQSENANHG